VKVCWVELLLKVVISPKLHQLLHQKETSFEVPVKLQWELVFIQAHHHQTKISF